MLYMQLKRYEMLFDVSHAAESGYLCTVWSSDVSEVRSVLALCQQQALMELEACEYHWTEQGADARASAAAAASELGLFAEEEEEGGEEEQEEDEDYDAFLERCFDDGGRQDYHAPEGSSQSAYWTDGLTIVREKAGGKWRYHTEDDGR